MISSEHRNNSSAAITTNPLPRVIFLEDDRQLRIGLTDYLRLSAISVTDVATGAEFDRALSSGTFDIALLDVNLPDANGFEIARKLSATNDLGVIILTARASRADRLEGYSEGADLYLTKPVDSEELVLAIRNLHRRVTRARGQTGGTSSPSVEKKGWVLSSSAQSLTTPNGEIVFLSGRETNLLRCLSEAGGQTVSRQHVSISVGYDELEPSSRSLDAVVRRLRQKLKAANADLPVHSIYGQGFRFAGQIQVIS